MGSRQSFATPHSRVPSAMIGQYTLKPDTHSNRDTGKRLFFGVSIRLGMTFNYLGLWVRVKGQG